jgi:hypothetical protein
MQYSETLRNNQLDQIESTVGVTPLLRIFSGVKPGSTAQADSGTMLLQTALPSDWLNAASAGSKTLLGTWLGTGHANAGTGTAAGHFRIYDAAGSACHLQGSITVTGGGGDMTLVNTSIAENQTVQITGFTVTAGNA